MCVYVFVCVFVCAFVCVHAYAFVQAFMCVLKKKEKRDSSKDYIETLLKSYFEFLTTKCKCLS